MTGDGLNVIVYDKLLIPGDLKMIVLQAQDIDKSLGGHDILHQVSFTLEAGDKTGLVGVNGVGKTTLIKCLNGEIQPDRGQVIYGKEMTTGCLEQLPAVSDESSLWDAVMEGYTDLLDMRRQMELLEEKISTSKEPQNLLAGYARTREAYERSDGDACETNARRILAGLGFTDGDYSRLLNTLSGGEKTRLHLARLLSSRPDILFLDEPTNHLDIAAVEWLESFIGTYPGTVLLVSHDRMFLDQVCNRIIELRQGRLISYQGNYSRYVQQRARDDAAREKSYQHQQEYLARTEEYIRRNKAGIKARQARGRQKQLERYEIMEKPGDDKKPGQWEIVPLSESGQDVLEIKDLGKAYGEEMILDQVQLHLRRGERVAVIGPNGSGKSTLLKIIMGKTGADRGEIKIGSRVHSGYFAQEFEDLDGHKTVLEEVLAHHDIDLQEARDALGKMLFSEDDVYKRVENLSGGEKARLALLQLTLAGPNFLLLDEPTNHLDIESCTAVEEMIGNYPGTVLFVSHDRYFIDRVATHVAALENNRLRLYWGNYSYYREKLQKDALLKPDGEERAAASSQQQYRMEIKAKERNHKRLTRQLQTLENEIYSLEERRQQLQEMLVSPDIYQDYQALQEQSSKQKQVDEEIRRAYEEWEKVSDELAHLERAYGG